MMTKGFRRLRGNAALGARDFIFGLALFWGLALGICWTQDTAHAVNLPKGDMIVAQASAPPAGRAPLVTPARTYAAAAERPIPRFEASATGPAFVVLGFVFAALTMMNLAFARHLHRTYARPRVRRAPHR
ncbi:MAG: hypothetical protein EKK41_14125 [Hyphomicrobiales bacterium]|nr:MAG: hypothetical protein EKK41_14125 [Hyphomicrobiales bacterium]